MTSPKTLAELRANVASDERQEGTRLPNNYFTFWKMQEGQKAVVRFVPDANPNNPRGFYIIKLMHKLVINGDEKTVPCLTMYEEDCPICATSQKFYKVEGKESPNGKKYWRKKQHLAQALVIEDPLPANDEGETNKGKLRLIAIGYQLYQIIYNALKADDILQDMPYLYETGCDFVIAKDKGPKYSTYQLNSRFRNIRAISDDELAIISENQIDLNTLIPKKPERAMVEALLQAALTGENFSGPAPEGEDVPDETDVTPPARKAAPVKAAAILEEPTPFETKQAPKAASAGDADVDDMLATIKARRAATKSGAAA